MTKSIGRGRSHDTLFLLCFSQLSALTVMGKMWGSILVVVYRSSVVLHSTQAAPLEAVG